MDKVDQSVIFKGYTEIEIKGETYHVRPLNMNDVIDGVLAKTKLAVPPDKDHLGDGQLYNLANEDTRNDLFALMESHLFKNGNPFTGEEARELKWEMPDVGLFLYTLVRASG